MLNISIYHKIKKKDKQKVVVHGPTAKSETRPLPPRLEFIKHTLLYKSCPIIHIIIILHHIFINIIIIDKKKNWCIFLVRSLSPRTVQIVNEYNTAGASSQCYWDEQFLLNCEIMLVKCQFNTNTTNTIKKDFCILQNV